MQWEFLKGLCHGVGSLQLKQLTSIKITARKSVQSFPHDNCLIHFCLFDRPFDVLFYLGQLVS